MATSYHIVDHQGKSREFDHPQEMVFFLLDKNDHVDIYYLSLIHIGCDLSEGKVSTFDDQVQVSPHVTNSMPLNPETKNKIINTISTILSLVAKINFLQELGKLDDSEMRGIIKRYAADPQQWENKGYTIDQMHAKANFVLARIIFSCREGQSDIQKNLYDVLKNRDVIGIHSKGQVKEIMALINKEPMIPVPIQTPAPRRS